MTMDPKSAEELLNRTIEDLTPIVGRDRAKRIAQQLLINIFGEFPVSRTPLDDIRDRATITVPEAAKALGISVNAAYRAVEAGELPALRLGRRILIPVPRLLAILEGRCDRHEWSEHGWPEGRWRECRLCGTQDDLPCGVDDASTPTGRVPDEPDPTTRKVTGL